MYQGWGHAEECKNSIMHLKECCVNVFVGCVVYILVSVVYFH